MNKHEVVGLILAVLNALIAIACFVGIFVAIYFNSYWWVLWYALCVLLNGYCAKLGWEKVK